MSNTGLAVFDDTLQKTNIWLNEIGEVIGPDRHRSYQALRAVLHCLRDRLTVDEAAHLSAQLPMLVRGIYYEGYRPAGKPATIRSRDEFLAHIARYLENVRPIDPADAARAVFRTLQHHCDPGEIRDVLQSLPAEIRTLWPQHTRYTVGAPAQAD